MFTVSRVSKSFAGRVLFEEASLQVNIGDRIGLIGPNGAGKTTLFSLLLRTDEPDEGTISLQRGVRCGRCGRRRRSLRSKTKRLTATLEAQFAELAKMEKSIRGNLEMVNKSV
jgi:ATP-binding cassette, subfamily F, member 3